MKQSLTILILILALHNLSTGQSFLKTYNDPTNPNASVSFECITEKADSTGNLYIGGHIGDTITLFKVNTSGVVLAAYKIRTSPANTRLDAIMLVLDASTNRQKLVVLGNIQNSFSNQGFIFRFDPLNPLNPTVDWFRQTNAGEQINYWDMADKTGNFYIVSAEKQINGSALILKVNKNNGTTTIANNYKVDGLEDPSAIQFSGSKLYATGRYATPGGDASGDGFRACFSRFNASSYAHLGTYFYMRALCPTDTARMYTFDILVQGSNAIMVGNGDDNNTLDPLKNLSITKVNANNGVLIWSRKYDDPFAASDGTLTEIRLDNSNNYTVMGFSANASTGNLDKARLMSINPANGNVLWNRQYNFYRRTTNGGVGYGYGFTVIGNNIYAVGQNSTTGLTKGVLLKVNTANGNVSHNDGTNCYDSPTIQTSSYTLYDSIPVSTLIDSIKAPKQAKSATLLKIADSLVCGTTCAINGVVDVSTPQICRGDSVTLYATGNSGVAPYSYLWSPSGSVNCPTCSTTVAHPQVTTNYQVTITDALGCSTVKNITVTVDTTCCVSCTLNTTIIHTPRGILTSLKCGDTTVVACGNNYVITPTLNCNGNSSSHITNAIMYDQNGNSAFWAATFLSNFGNGTLSIPANTAGFYTLKYYWGVANHVCDSCSYTLKIQCCGNFSVSAGPDIVKCTPTVQLSATAFGGVSPYTYSWSPVTGLNNPNIFNPTCSTTGTYVVTVTDAVGCIKTDTVKIVSGGNGCRPIVQNMKQNELSTASNKLQAVPNPYTNSFMIQGLESTAISLEILNMEGRVVTRYTHISPQQSFGKQLSAGVYLVKIYYKDGSSKTLKTIKN